MQINLVWHSTGDAILFDVIHEDVARWFVNTCDQFGNKFSPGTQVVDVLKQSYSTDELIAQEIAYVNTVNQALQKYRMPVQFELPTDWYSQQQLNRLHKSWAQSRLNVPRLTEFLYKVDPKLFEAYQEMNCHIHFIENSFCYYFRDQNNWRQDNPFKDQAFDWHCCHLQITYPGHGRSAFEKFQYRDDRDDWELDNVNWTNIDAYINVDLTVRPHQIDPPREFLQWCQHKNLVPHRDQLALANVHNWQENLDHARHVVAKNVKIPNNYFVLELIE